MRWVRDLFITFLWVNVTYLESNMFPLLKWMKCTILNNKIGGELKEFSSNHVTRFLN